MSKTSKSFFLLVLASLLVYGTAHSQFLPANANGKCEITEVVIAEGFSKSNLYGNELKWLNGLTREEGKLSSLVRDSIAGRISGTYEFLVYTQSGVLRKVAGAISYYFTVETKDGKYRYSFTDFVFYYYAQNRNYKIVKTGNTKPLEEKKAIGWQKLWTEHRMTVFTRVTKQIDALKLKIIETSKEVNEKMREKKVDW